MFPNHTLVVVTGTGTTRVITTNDEEVTTKDMAIANDTTAAEAMAVTDMDTTESPCGHVTDQLINDLRDKRVACWLLFTLGLFLSISELSRCMTF